MEAFFELIPSHDEEPTKEFPTPRRLSRLPANSKSISSSSSYAKKLQSAFMTDQPPKPAPSKTRRPAWNRLPVNIHIQYENSTNEDFPPLPAKTNSDETRSTASSTRLTFNDHSIQKAIAESKSEWQADTTLPLLKDFSLLSASRLSIRLSHGLCPPGPSI
jgi:hypothetical protein